MGDVREVVVFAIVINESEVQAVCIGLRDEVGSLGTKPPADLLHPEHSWDV